ncbi:MAG: glycosyltransferase [Anaerolineales bacterium]
MKTVNSLVAYTTNTWVSPLATLRILGPAYHAGIQVVKGNQGEQIDPEKVSSADLVLIQRDFPRHTRAYQEIVARAREQGKPLVFDLDDLLLELPEDHPDRLNHYYSAALLPMLHAILEADAVTASTAPLCDYLRPLNPRTWLLPNYLDDRLWNMRPIPDREEADQPVVIGYMGGDSHTPDLIEIAPALSQILEHYGERVRLEVLGTRPPSELQGKSNVRWSPAQTFEYAQFAAGFLQQDYHIVIAPLRETLFNRCKSAIKFLEYSALGAPGVYSRIDPYAGVVEHGENGFLASNLEEWQAYLSRLIEDPDLRRRMGAKAQETVRERWLLSQHAQAWTRLYEQLLSAPPGEMPQSSVRPESILHITSQVMDENAHLQEKQQVLTSQLKEQRQQAKSLRQQLAGSSPAGEAEQRLAEIYSSRSWKLVQGLWRARLALVPAGSRRESMLRAGMQRLRALKNKGWRGLLDTAEKSGQPGTDSPAVPAQPAQPLTPSSGTSTIAFIQPSSDEVLRMLPGRVLKQDLIVLPVIDWESRIQRPQQIAMRFAQAGQRVFYMHTSFHQGTQPVVRMLAENIFEVKLPAPQATNLYSDSLTETVTVAFENALASLRRSFHIAQAVCLVDLPFWTPLALRLRQTFGWKVVYDCMDHHRGFSTNSPQMLAQEDRLSQHSDLILTTSHFLLEEKSRQNANTIRVPNGADFDHFRYPPTSLPPEIDQLERPVIGYYGAIADWFNTGLVRDLATARPEWNFTLIGSTLYADLEPLQGLQNVHLLGEMPYSRLPAYLHAFDVAIIPFKATPLTQATNPVKLFEYLSAGKPVVATTLDELRHYEEYARLASTPEQWLAEIESALQEDSASLMQARLAFARQNTWEQRFAQIAAAIQELYAQVSIIVVTYNNLDYNRLCLESIFEQSVYPNYEVIVVDNASTDGTRAYLQTLAEQHANLKVIFNPNNAGFASANNRGASAAQGERLVFLNNDTVVTRGWLAALSHHLRDSQVGMVGPVTNFSGNESRIEVDYRGIDDMQAFAWQYVNDHHGQTFEIGMLPWLCVMLRRAVFEEVGPLDERFGIGMFEDDDYALRLKAKGYRILCAEDVFIHHWGSASFSKLDQAAYQQLFEENRRKFETKWGLEWQPHRYRNS